MTKWPKMLAIFFVIFGQVDVFYILVEFEVDGMRPNESTKNGQKGAHEFNCKIFVIYDIYDKNYSRKKINVSSTILIFLPLNHLRYFGIFDLLGFVGAIQFSVEEIE